MKRHGLRQLTAALMCALLCVTSFAPALAEDGVAVPMLPDQATPVSDAPVVTNDSVEPDPTEKPVQAVKVNAIVDGSTVSVSVTADTAYAVVVSLTKTDAAGNVTTYDSVTLKPGAITARFDNVPAGSYTLKSNYKTSDVPKAKAATMPIVIAAPVVTAAPTAVPTPEPTAVPTPEPTAVPTPEPTAVPVQEPAVMPLLPESNAIAPAPAMPQQGDTVGTDDPITDEQLASGGVTLLPGDFTGFDTPVMPVPDVSMPGDIPETFVPDASSDGPATLETPQDSPVQPMLPSTGTDGQTPSQDGSTQQNPDIMLPMLPIEKAPQIAEVPEIPGGDTPEALASDGATPDEPDNVTGGDNQENPGDVTGGDNQQNPGDGAEGDADGSDDPTLPGEDDILPLAASSPVVVGQTISGTISNVAENHTVVVTLTGGAQPLTQEFTGTADKSEFDYEFTGVLPGNYTLAITDTTAGNTPALSLTIVVPEPSTTASVIEANAQGGKTTVTVNVTKASRQLVTVDLYKGDQTVANSKNIASGIGSVTFEGLEAGTYSVNIYYADLGTGVGSTAIGNIVVTGETRAITIASVTPGENKLTVTGTAEPGSDITFTTEPSSASTVVHVDENGNYSADLALAAGTYTAVHAQYGSDAASRVSATGTYVVFAPAEKPKLYVDPITTSDWIIYAKTTPGVMVNLSTYDHSTTVVADSRGILLFSLPHEYPKDTPVTFTVYYGKDNVQSYQQIETVVGPISYKLLKKGSTGDAVYDLTQRLSDLGYPVSPTYTYTDEVANAVRLFQSLNGLAVDGMAGQLTQSALFSVWAIGYLETGVYPTLVRGNRGMALIYTLQQRLKDLGYYTIRVDGIFGSGTERAVRDFQRVNGLTVTGRADNATQQLLYSSAALPAWYYGGNYGTLARSGYYNPAVVPLQRRLRELGYYTGNVDGYFGSQTQRAVRNFQSRNGLTVTGVADSYMQQVLYSAAAVAASGSGSGSSSSTGYRLLYWGCKGDAVRRLQQALLDAGYKQVRVADGIYGQWTYDAVRAYQKDHGLAVDGIAGRKTQNSLYGTNY